jgi:hypothetical protein
MTSVSMKNEPIDTTSPEFRARAEQRRRTWGMTTFTRFDDVKAAEYAYWAMQPTHAVMTAVAEMTTEAYAMKGIHVSRLQRPDRTLK